MKKDYETTYTRLETNIEKIAGRIENRAGKAKERAALFCDRHRATPGLARVHRLLSKKKYVRPTHTILCECRTCKPSVRTWHKRIMTK